MWHFFSLNFFFICVWCLPHYLCERLIERQVPTERGNSSKRTWIPFFFQVIIFQTKKTQGNRHEREGGRKSKNWDRERQDYETVFVKNINFTESQSTRTEHHLSHIHTPKEHVNIPILFSACLRASVLRVHMKKKRKMQRGVPEIKK